MSTRRGKRLPELTLDEAVRISRAAQLGLLDEDDSRIAELVREAHQLTVRGSVWGDVPVSQERRSRRLLAIGVSAVVLVSTSAVVGPYLLRLLQ
jgi:hypothetical protein